MTRFGSGPEVGSTLENFQLLNHENVRYQLTNLMGESGILVGFSGDIWDLGSVRRVLWLQRQVYKLSMSGIMAAIVVPNETYELNGFYMSIPRMIPFPLLADPNREIHELCQIEFPGFVLLDRNRTVTRKWFLQSGATPRTRDIIQATANV